MMHAKFTEALQFSHGKISPDMQASFLGWHISKSPMFFIFFYIFEILCFTLSNCGISQVVTVSADPTLRQSLLHRLAWHSSPGNQLRLQSGYFVESGQLSSVIPLQLLFTKVSTHKRPSITQSIRPSYAISCRGCARSISYYTAQHHINRMSALELQLYSYYTCWCFVVAGASCSTPGFTAAVRLWGGTLEMLKWCVHGLAPTGPSLLAH